MANIKDHSGLQQNNPDAKEKALATRKAKKEAEEAVACEVFNSIVNVGLRVRQLDRLGMRYLSGKEKWSREQALVFKSMFETYSSKIMPPAKPKKEETKKPTINISGLPEEMK